MSPWVKHEFGNAQVLLYNPLDDTWLLTDGGGHDASCLSRGVEEQFLVWLLQRSKPKIYALSYDGCDECGSGQHIVTLTLNEEQAKLRTHKHAMYGKHRMTYDELPFDDFRVWDEQFIRFKA